MNGHQTNPHGGCRHLPRRDFLAAASAALPVALGVRASGPSASMYDEPVFRISLAEWSLHRTLDTGALTNLEFPMVARNEYGVEAVEYVNSFFKDKATDRGYLTELRSRAEDAGVRNLLIMCDGEGAIGDPSDAGRRRAIENHYRWVDAAAFLDCHSIRVNAQSEGSPEEQRRLVVDGLRRLTAFAAERGINVIVENHGGLSSNGAWLASVMDTVQHPRCGTLPDFGNFHLGENEWYDRYQGVAELMPYAKAVSAKSNEFDASGEERQTDFLRMLRVVLDAGYRGYVGIEYEGSELSEPEGIRATKALLERVRQRLGDDYR